MTVLWTRPDLIAATGGHFLAPATPGDAIRATGVSIDTRTLAAGDIFVALVGENSDGHAHITRALEAGAAVVIAHRDTGVEDPRILLVEDTLAALNAMAAFARDRFSGRMIAVTGSVGKTTTKDMLRHALGACGPTHWAVASYNNHWGVPLTLARLPASAMFCVCEVGMNNPGEIAPLARMVRPDVAVITTITGAHLGHMGSLEAIAREKSDLIAALPHDGVAIVPDDVTGMAAFTTQARRHGAHLWTAGTLPDSTARMEDYRPHPSGGTFRALIDGWSGTVELHAPGRHMAANALLALAAARAVGADMARAVRGLADFRPGAGRGAITPILDGQASLLDESYNASVASIRATLDVLGQVPARRRIAVLGDMLELGTFARDQHESLLPAVRKHADLVFCCGPNMKYLFDLLPSSQRGAWTPDAATLAPMVRAQARAGDAILVKGSLGLKMRQVVDALRAPTVDDDARGRA
ncbi:UDP-N-acetylmuramoyl-tripeptide--D-alanyl-D-alanine ligase [Gluconacetobacter entanii]|uniref:UDP-N-acetylmuramoyl-tripeptide--D-alanyl-D- alanine ligase n=1 Tax=Gluconacetobacter entanii TaxID=108528 RepID=UPI001C936843|nr:UDP-N-acetylmuramoyl-tripeptide--D-alanyl-D-alanine ligase [Gluconacetobacter entanii]MBY4638758.1 UDP-N-acetylmuramoyl-tripeptide--D-alanyl-D-alanine ligase [Gluconacetobacter entanii]MCW4581777.1 UDP-N-acetylmuramoyl-tripeptide--D-alanyl-D-alanine ligase [Gluconacetobacter entanii]MCW4585105.1 UDP-N-acetylmuramoyl-tripeptide--D-alanyl-D-alanine ligase [Gluconacetobacter entanii]MCW4588733.1 UDP-N-acetylmuramoyl-tripeptide--D-alanyl-D-alanine ligase [Gluconacetobacter entanii]